MKTTSILLSLALAFKTIYSKAIDNAKIISEQLNVIEEDNSFELVESDNFIYKFHCSEEQEYCDKLKNDLEYAFTTISNAFEIYQPIVFEVFVDDLIGKYKMNALAAVLDPNFVSLKSSRSRSSTPYLYPQALVKQLRLNKEPKYKKNDFIMVVNNCNSVPELKDNELRSIIIHEIFHGLGFMSSIPIIQLTDNDVFDIDSPAKPIMFNETDKYAFFPYRVPLYNEELLEITNEEEYLDKIYNTEFSKFMPFNIFDKNLVSIKSGKKLLSDIKSYHKEVNRNCLPEDGSSLLLKESTEKALSDCFESLSSKTQRIITRSIKENFFETHALGILTDDGEMIPLQTLDGMFLTGSSISHINNPIYDKAYAAIEEGHIELLEEIYDLSTGKVNKEAAIKYYDENFVLYFSDEDDFTIEEMLELLPNNKNHPLIGNGIIKIMKTLGWTEKGKRESSKRYYLDESIDVPEANVFEYLYKRRYEISNHDTPSTETEIEIETTTLYLIEEQPTFQSDGEPTAPAEEVETTLFENEEEPTFPAEEFETTVLLDEEEPTFPAEEIETSLAADEVEATVPVDEEEPTFPAEEVETVPVDEEEPTFPAEEVETVAVDEEEPTFPAEEVETVVVDEEEPTFPAEEVETIAVDEEEPTFPAEEVETIAVDEEEPTFPAEEVETTVPVNEDEVDEEEPILPVDEGKVDEVESTLPVDEAEPTLPVDEPTLPLDKVELTFQQNPIKYILLKLKELLKKLLL